MNFPNKSQLKLTHPADSEFLKKKTYWRRAIKKCIFQHFMMNMEMEGKIVI